MLKELVKKFSLLIKIPRDISQNDELRNIKNVIIKNRLLEIAWEKFLIIPTRKSGVKITEFQDSSDEFLGIKEFNNLRKKITYSIIHFIKKTKTSSGIPVLNGFSLDHMLIPVMFLVKPNDDSEFKKIRTVPLDKIILLGLRSKDSNSFVFRFSLYWTATVWNCNNFIPDESINDHFYNFILLFQSIVKQFKLSRCQTAIIFRDVNFNLRNSLISKLIKKNFSINLLAKKLEIDPTAKDFLKKSSDLFQRIPWNMCCLPVDLMFGNNDITHEKIGFDSFSTFSALNIIYGKRKYTFNKVADTNSFDESLVPDRNCHVIDIIYGTFIINFLKLYKKYGVANWPLKCLSIKQYNKRYLSDPKSLVLTPKDYFRLSGLLTYISLPKLRLKYLKKFIQINFPHIDSRKFKHWSFQYKRN